MSVFSGALCLLISLSVCVEWSFMPVDIFKVSVLRVALCLLITVSVLSGALCLLISLSVCVEWSFMHVDIFKCLC